MVRAFMGGRRLPRGRLRRGRSRPQYQRPCAVEQGLITVRRRNGRWSAKLNETGRFYLENQRFPVPADADPVAQYAAIRPERQEKVDTRTAHPPPPKPKAPTESLVAEVAAAGGVLSGKDLAEYADGDQLVLAPNRFRKTPPGTQLAPFRLRECGR